MNDHNPTFTKPLHCYIDRYGDLFKVYRRENKEKACQYLEGLFHEGKHNIERMNERIAGSEYQQLHHFISVSPWDHIPVICRVSKDLSALFESTKGDVGLILDESGHRKKGKKSVGVCRQYLGSLGKVDNGQVAVFAALSQGNKVGMVDTRLFLPKVWIENKPRCDKAGIPKANQVYKTKPELGLQMIEQMEARVTYDWVGGDSIYGNSKHLRTGLSRLNQLYIMDVSEDFQFYLRDPKPYVPASQEGRGRKKSSFISDEVPIKAEQLKERFLEADWEISKIRNGTKGPMIRKIIVTDIYLWSAKRVPLAKAEKLRLLISCEADGSEVKYSVTNDVSLSNHKKLTNKQLLYRQMQRYWVERGIQICKDSLGMTDYQVRGWRAWHHHMTITIMALHFMLEQKILHQKEIPLLSCPDIKFFLALTLKQKTNNPEQAWSLIQKRHEQRQNDLNRYK